MNKEQARLVDRLYKEMMSGNLGIFAGAGFSQGAGYVNWKELLRPIADDLNLDIDSETDLVAIAQYHFTQQGDNRSRLNQQLVEAFSKRSVPTENHRILARLPISTYWTTNYDRLIENALEDANKIVDAKYAVSQLPITRYKRDAVVYKMHGDVEHPNDAILTRYDYERYHLVMAPFIDALKGDLVSKTLLFMGFSFTDPNLDYILSRVRIAFEQNRRKSECIIRRLSREDGESEAKFEYRQRKQGYFEAELTRYGLTVTHVDDYSEITVILRALEARYRHQSIFISGAAHDYAPYDKEEAERFVFSLSKQLSLKEKRIISGFGLGVGSAVVAGVIEATSTSGKALDDDRLVVRPFPQSEPGAMSRQQAWSKYRDDILSRAGIAIFLFGNKLEDGDLVLSDGMREEFNLALKHRVFPLPVGATGYVSRDLWEEVIARIRSGELQVSPEVDALIHELGDETKSLDELMVLVLKLVSLI